MDNFSPDQIKAMINMLQSMLAQTGNDNDETKPIASSKKKKVHNKSKPQKPKRPNKFMDMPEMHMHKEDILLDKKLSVQPPVPRARPFTLIRVICRVCGKTEEVNPNLIHDGVDRYKCNKCSSSAG